jgi:hypothetical protein
VKRGGPLRRKTPLKAKPWKRKVPAEYEPFHEAGTGIFGPPRKPMKRSRLNPISAKKRAERKSDALRVKAGGLAFAEAIVGKRCVVCGRTAKEAFVATGCGHQAHHGVAQSWLRRHGMRALLWDVRNSVCVCEEPCHRQHTDGAKRIPIMALPDSVIEFANEVGAEAHIVRTYASQ